MTKVLHILLLSAALNGCPADHSRDDPDAGGSCVYDPARSECVPTADDVSCTLPLTAVLVDTVRGCVDWTEPFVGVCPSDTVGGSGALECYVFTDEGTSNLVLASSNWPRSIGDSRFVPCSEEARLEALGLPSCP